MKSSRLTLAALLALAASAPLPPSLRADDALPKAQPAGRYEPMASRSPFMAPTSALPTPTPAPVAAGPHWWDQMVVTSLMEAGGTFFAAVVDKSNNKRYVLESGKPDEDSHLLLASVQWNERADQSTVTVRKGTEIAPPLRFDPTAVASAPAAAPQPFSPSNPPRYQAGMANPPLPPGFTGTPPPPPPMTNVVRRGGPIGSVPAPPGNPSNGTVPNRPQDSAPRRKIRPLGGTEPGSE